MDSQEHQGYGKIQKKKMKWAFFWRYVWVFLVYMKFKKTYSADI